MSESGGIATAVVDGFQVSSNTETSEQIKSNLTSDPAPKDGPPLDPEEEEKSERSKAAAKLGKAGGEAAAKAKAAVDESERRAERKMAKDADLESEPAKAKAEPEEAEEAPEKPSRAQARIQQLARERAEERSKRIELENRLARLEAERAPQAPPKPATERVQGDEEPRPDGFETYEDYVKAVARHAARSERDAVLREQAESARQAAHAETVVKKVETFNQRIKANPALLEQVDSRLLDLQPTFTLPPGPDGRPQIGPANVLADEIVGSENPDKLLLYLSQHEDEVRKILSSRDPYELARRVGMVEARLGIEAAPPEAPARRETYSKAAPPVRPVVPSAASDDDVDADDDFDSYVKRANARDARLKRG